MNWAETMQDFEAGLLQAQLDQTLMLCTQKLIGYRVYQVASNELSINSQLHVLLLAADFWLAVAVPQYSTASEPGLSAWRLALRCQETPVQKLGWAACLPLKRWQTSLCAAGRGAAALCGCAAPC